MHMLRRLSKPVSSLLVVMVFWLGMPMQSSNAEMIGTQDALDALEGPSARQRLTGFMERRDVQAELQARGIDPAEARARIDSLSDAEVAQIAGKLDQLPAGGDASIIGALVFIFVLLLITDLLGLTHIFPFVYHRR